MTRTLLALLLLLPNLARAGMKDDVARLTVGGAVLAVDAAEATVVDIRGTESVVPASTIKVVTTLLAADTMGLDYRFRTHFWVTDGWLVVRGEGDPSLVSEELDLVAQALVPLLPEGELRGVRVDDGYFAAGIDIPGVGNTTEPYDALNSALAVNFNTINVRVTDGTVVSAEPQTPITPLASEIARRRGVRGEARINLSARADDVRRYAGELIAAKLRAQGARIGDRVEQGQAPDVEPLYTHRSSKTLAQVCEGMLRYSNNYTANQVFLAVGAHVEGGPASLDKSVRVATKWLADCPDLLGIVMVEGSGIGYDNRVTGRAMVAAMRRMEPYIDLLRDRQGTPSKTGTLTIAKTLVGFVDSASRGRIRYAIFLDGGGSQRRWDIVKILKAL